jgi:hypothetical protein
MPLRMGKQRRLVAEGQEEANQVLNILLEELSRRASKSDFPPGRGQLVRRNRRYLVQVAHAEAKEIISRVTTDAFV